MLSALRRRLSAKREKKRRWREIMTLSFTQVPGEAHVNRSFKQIPTVPAGDVTDRQWPARTLRQAPRWCSSDLRDGNQALAEPMDNARKREFYHLLLQCGFKEIEVAFLRRRKRISILCAR